MLISTQEMKIRKWAVCKESGKNDLNEQRVESVSNHCQQLSKKKSPHKKTEKNQ